MTELVTQNLKLAPEFIYVHIRSLHENINRLFIEFINRLWLENRHNTNTQWHAYNITAYVHVTTKINIREGRGWGWGEKRILGPQN